MGRCQCVVVIARTRQAGYAPDSDHRPRAPPASQPPCCPAASPASSTSKCNHFSPRPRPPAQPIIACLDECATAASGCPPSPPHSVLPRVATGHLWMPSQSTAHSVQSPPRAPISFSVKAQVLPTAQKALHDLPNHLPAITSSSSPP